MNPPYQKTSRRILIILATIILFALVFKGVASVSSKPATKTASRLSVTGKAYVISDIYASGGKALELFGNSRAKKQIVTPDVAAVVITAKGDQCNGAPLMGVQIDGVGIQSVEVDSTSYKTFTLPLTSVSAGSHEFEIEFTNDFYLPGNCDRNLIIDDVRFTPLNNGSGSSVAGSGGAGGAASTSTSSGSSGTSTGSKSSTSTGGRKSSPAPSPSPSPSPLGSALQPDYDSAWGTANYSGTNSGPFTVAIHREDISIVADPAGLPRKVAMFAVKDSDTGPTSNPRAQLQLPAFINDGDEIWQGLSIWYPSNFPTTVHSPVADSFVTHTSNYGPPYQGTPPVSMGSYGGTYQFGARLYGSGTYAWAINPQHGVWHDFIFRTKFSSTSNGYLEAWHNQGQGWQHLKVSNTGSGGTFGTVSSDGYRWIGRTIDSANAAPPLDARIALYYGKGQFVNTNNPLIIYYGPAKWRKTRTGDTAANLMATVDPHTYD